MTQTWYHILIELAFIATEGNDFRIFKTRFKYDLRNFYFTNRVVDAWNSLPYYIVTANNTNIFKRILGAYWQDQDILYDFHAQLQRTGSRNEVFRHEYVCNM